MWNPIKKALANVGIAKQHGVSVNPTMIPNTTEIRPGQSVRAKEEAELFAMMEHVIRKQDLTKMFNFRDNQEKFTRKPINE
jgi:hypothetical protein